AVMDKGRIIQVGSATDVYEYPNSRFVAGFIGSINFLDGTVTSIEDGIASIVVPEFGKKVSARAVPGITPGMKATLAIRPEKIAIARRQPTGINDLSGVVEGLAYFGKDSLYRVKLPSGRVLSVNSVNARRVGEHDRVADWEDEVCLSFDPGAAILLTD
ncbi:MAG: TOBE domain-containing protein, partial [Oricola sp.]